MLILWSGDEPLGVRLVLTPPNKEMIMKNFWVIDDYGDNWENGPVASKHHTLAEAEDWAESENFHSASIVEIVDGKRTRVA